MKGFFVFAGRGTVNRNPAAGKKGKAEKVNKNGAPRSAPNPNRKRDERQAAAAAELQALLAGGKK